MPYSFSFDVAGIRFDVVSSDELRLPQPWATYEPFVIGDGAPRSCDVCVRLSVRVGVVPDMNRCQPVFESSSWSLYREGDAYWLTLAPVPGTRRAPWAARLEPDFLSGEVFCDPDLVREHSDRGIMFNPVLHRLDQIIAMYVLADRGGAIIHGTGVVANETGVVWAGRSGSGKTTLARLLAGAPEASSWKLLNDDRIIVREENAGRYRIYGTPWAGEAQMALNVSAPLRGLAFLKHGASDRLERLGAAAAAEELLPVVSVPWYDAVRVASMTDFCHRLVGRVPAWRFEFAPTSNVWKLAHEVFQSLEK